MSTTESITSASDHAETLHFPVRRDGWDTVDFYLPLFIGSQAGGLFFIVLGISLLHETTPKLVGWVYILMGTIHFVLGTIGSVFRTWRRFAEQYELTESQFVLQCGYCRQRARYREISGVHPIKICRSTTALKPAVRIKFRKPIAPPGGEYAGGTIEFDIFGYKRSQPLLQAWSLDVSPVNLEGFLEELATRCPHLQREGPRFNLKSTVESIDGPSSQR
ncbi:MAG: hypothetical protein EXS05_09175 [Planctomycetaceae bacterium]|nr:hypothetical protein [Planctomycetaceae bacterium]